MRWRRALLCRVLCNSCIDVPTVTQRHRKKSIFADITERFWWKVCLAYQKKTFSVSLFCRLFLFPSSLLLSVAPLTHLISISRNTRFRNKNTSHPCFVYGGFIHTQTLSTTLHSHAVCGVRVYAYPSSRAKCARRVPLVRRVLIFILFLPLHAGTWCQQEAKKSGLSRHGCIINSIPSTYGRCRMFEDHATTCTYKVQ